MRILIVFLLIFISVKSISQENNRFYASYEDYLGGKYIEGWKIVELSWMSNFGGKESLKVIHNGIEDRKKLADLPSELYTFDNILNRTFEGDCHIVLLIGPICVYAWIGDNRGVYYSTGIKGEMKRFTQKYLEQLLKEHGLLDQYKADNIKREFRDTPSSYYTKVVERNLKYVRKINEELSR